MPPSFLESETLLMVLKNLMRQAYDRELKARSGEPGKAPQHRSAAAAPRRRKRLSRHASRNRRCRTRSSKISSSSATRGFSPKSNSQSRKRLLAGRT